MAKKKNSEQVEEVITAETPETNIPAEEIKAVEIPEQEDVEIPESIEAPDPQPEEIITEVEQNAPIPAKVLAYLNRHPEVESVYVDKLGGSFPSDTPTVFVKDAVLYHNPYYNK